MTLTVIVHDIKKIEAEALIVGFYEDVRPLKGLAGELDWLLCGSLSTLLLTNKVNGSLGDTALITSRGKVPAPKIFLIGLGPVKKVTPASLRTVARTAATAALKAGVTKAAMEYFRSPEGTPDAQLQALREGLREGSNARPLDVALIAPDAGAYETLSKLVKHA